jgi:acetolactate synthase I/III small subunit
MPDPIQDPKAPTSAIELLVRNHPGTMSHITGLFSRRGFNMEAIVCVPVDGGAESRILLLVPDEPRLEQVERQLVKLYDVIELRLRPDLGPGFFAGISDLMGPEPGGARRASGLHWS